MDESCVKLYFQFSRAARIKCSVGHVLHALLEERFHKSFAQRNWLRQDVNDGLAARVDLGDLHVVDVQVPCKRYSITVWS